MDHVIATTGARRRKNESAGITVPTDSRPVPSRDLASDGGVAGNAGIWRAMRVGA
jgi:hypothetical protein